MFDQPDRNTATADTWRMLTLLKNLPAAEYHLPGEPAPRVEPNLLKVAMDAMADRLTAIEAKPPVQPAPVDVAALALALKPHMEAAAEAAVRKVLGAVDGATPQG
jgi:hypothetical protein